jgi:hypothetical protein
MNMNARPMFRFSCCAISIFLVTLMFLAVPARAALGIDAKVSADSNSAANNVSSPAFSTTSGNELLLAFVSTDYVSGTNTTVTNVSGAGLTWALVLRTNVQRGTSEIWRAFSPAVLANVTVTATLSQGVYSSITVMSFSGVNTSGTSGSGAIGATKSANASSGAPTATLVTTQSGSWVFGVGNDYDNAISRTPAAGQSVVHQDLAPVGDTYWVQMQNSPTGASGTSVKINDTAPTSDRYNLSIVEVLPAAGVGGSTFTITGGITGGSGAVVTLSQNGTVIATMTADSSGNYTFNSIANGTYIVTPTKTGFSISPSSQTVTVSGANATVPNFTATAVTGGITGAITPSTAGSGAVVTISQNGTTVASVTSNSSGTYTFSNVANGNYNVTPTKTGFAMNPTTQTVTVNGTTATVPNFTATAVAWTVSGAITPSASGSGASLALTQGATTIGTAVANSSGIYSFAAISNGTYTVTPSKAAFTFNPPSQSVTVNGANATVPNFTAVAAPPTLLYPDLRDIIPPAKMSVVQTPTGRQFQYTHDTLNGGPGPLVIQPVYNPASGSYQGTQFVYSQNSSGAWSLAQTIPVAGVFVFDSDHGHFHFPYATYGLYTVAPGGGPGTAVAKSAKIGFCIDDSFLYDASLPNAGALGNLGPCSDPTTLRGLDIGNVDEYDQTDPGQSISIDGLPDGTYWLRALVDPNNFLAEANKANNETDVELTITGTTLQVLQTVVPVLNQPPGISLTAPVNGATIFGTVQMTASTGTTTGVQFLIDGQNFGQLVSTAPYTLNWDTTTVPNGSHWLAVQTTDSTGVIGTSSVALVTVSNTTGSGPIVQLTSPANGSILSSAVTLYATVASSQPIASVQFFVDFAPVGTPATAPPYMISWDSTTVPDGQHVVSASATDNLGNVTQATPVTVDVNNSHPPLLIGKDVSISVDGAGSITTPVFSTPTASDLLLAFVSYDGPSNTPQTATVSGAGLTWTLLERSNTEAGTAEIWSARADGILSSVSVTAFPGGSSSYHGSLTLIAFTNAAGTSVVGRTGALSGAPDIFLPGGIAGDWVFAVGNDWDSAVARTPVSGQVLVHQKVDTQVGDTYWVQSTATPSTANGLVDIHDTAPTADRWNYAAVEVVARHQ